MNLRISTGCTSVTARAPSCGTICRSMRPRSVRRVVLDLQGVYACRARGPSVNQPNNPDTGQPPSWRPVQHSDLQRGSPPSATSDNALRAVLRASSGVRTPTRPNASFRVLPAEFRYWTTHVRTPDGFVRRAKPGRSGSRCSVSRVTRGRVSTNRLVSLGIAASVELTDATLGRGRIGDTFGGLPRQFPVFPHPFS